MNPPAKLVAFLAAACGGLRHVLPRRHAVAGPAGAGADSQLRDGLTDGRRRWLHAACRCSATQKPGKDVPVEFRVTAPGGTVLSDLDEDAGEHVHLIAFRRDLTGYQHIIAQQGEQHVMVGVAQPDTRSMARDHLLSTDRH